MVRGRMFAILLILVVFLFAEVACAATYVIRPDGTGDFETILDAVYAAYNGDIIELTDGVFTGQGNRDIPLMGKAITIRSQSGDPASCVIDCEGSAVDPHRGFRFNFGEDSRSGLEGLMVRNCYLGDQLIGGAIYCEYTSPTLTNCWFIDNYCGMGGAIGCVGSAPEMTDCKFEGNISGHAGAIAIFWSSNPVITRCEFMANHAYNSGGATYI